MTAHRQHSIGSRVLALVAIGFGLLTIREGGAVLFFDGPARAAAGNYVPFVLWFNFLAGFVYVLAGVGLWLRRAWATGLAFTIAIATALVFMGFGLHMYTGGAWEPRTVVAMTVRTLAWAAIGLTARWLLPRRVQRGVEP